MRDSQKPCQHTLTDDAVYKEVVVIGNGPSGMVTSFMLAGNVPYLKEVPADLPIDDMLRARLENIPAGQSLYEADLSELAEGLEGRSQNPIPLLMDNLLRPCADLGIPADSLIEWKYDVEKQIDHIVLGRGPPGGAWHTFPPSVLTLSPAAWLSLPPYPAEGEGRLPARAVANYCRRYVQKCKLQRYFRSGVIVSSVRGAPRAGAPCAGACPHGARYVVSGYDKSCGRPFRILCKRVVVACGGGDRPNTLAPAAAPCALHSLSALQRALPTNIPNALDPPVVLVVGSGVSAADAVWLALAAGCRVAHVHRAPAPALARLDPGAYPDYTQVYKMMCDGPSGSHPSYTPYPRHVLAAAAPLSPRKPPKMADDEDFPKSVKLLDIVTNETTELTVSIIAVLIGSKPDLFFLQTNFNLNCIDLNNCTKCTDESKHAAKRKIEDNRCFLKNHWHYFKTVLGQSIQSCKSRYLNYSEINGNDTKCIVPDCNKRMKECKCEVVPYSDPLENKIKCQCQPSNPYSSGIGFGIDPKVGVDCRGNPVAIDKGTHEMLYSPGLYALGPLTADNFVRFIPGGALAAVAHMHKERKNE